MSRASGSLNEGMAWLQRAWLDRRPDLSEVALDAFLALAGKVSVPVPPSGAEWAAIARRERLSLRDLLGLVSALREWPADVAPAGFDPARVDGLLAEVAEAWTAQLEEVDRLRSEFISTLSHELRTPLTAIAGSCELLLEDFAEDLGDIHKEYIRLIERSTTLVRQLIDDVLDYTKLEAGEIKLHPESLHLGELVADTISLLTPLVEKKRLTLALDLDAGLSDVHGDPVRVRQILINLLSNAIKFTPEGGSVTVAARPAEHGLVALSVVDTGPGIAPDDQGQVFERFKQVGEGRRKRGTGLGLPITRRLVELHGGTIWLESEEGHGSTFTFTLQLAP